MRSSAIPSSFFFYTTFFIALVLNILPFPPWLTLFLPLWIPLLLIYWAMALPEKHHFIFASLLGLFVDALYGTYLGEHSLVFCMIVFFCYRFQLRFPLFPLVQQLIFIFIVLAVYQIVLFLIDYYLGRNPNFYGSWVTVLTTVFTWPLLKVFLKPFAPLSS